MIQFNEIYIFIIQSFNHSLHALQRGDGQTRAMVGGKLSMICEQIRGLQQQARKILDDAKKDIDLNHARCNFNRKPGNIYHLYRRDNGR